MTDSTNISDAGDAAGAPDGSAEQQAAPQFTDQQRALQHLTLDIERQAAELGWDRPPTLYALVPTGELLDTPGLPEDMAGFIRSTWDGTPEHLSALVQEGLEEDDLENVLGHLAWPDTVAGAALTVERIIVPPEVEAQAPEDPDEAIEFVMNHPSRSDVRIAVSALRSGETWTAIRTRAFDAANQVGNAPNLVPSLVQALQASLDHDLGDVPEPEAGE